MEVVSKTRKGKFLADDGIASAPILRALLIQVLTFGLSYLLYVVDQRQFGGRIPPFLLLGFHASISTLVSMLARLRWWWWLIQFFLPFAVVASLILNLHPGVSFAVFVAMVLLFWSTYRTQVPYFPSKSSLLPCILKQLPTNNSLCFIDVGSGFGGVSLNLAKLRPDQHFFGVEVAPIPWLVSWLRAKARGGTVRFLLKDYLQLDFAEFDVVFAYLSPTAMPELWKKAQREMRQGSLLMSYEFDVPGIEADLIIKNTANDPALYVWRI